MNVFFKFISKFHERHILYSITIALTQCTEIINTFQNRDISLFEK